MPQQPPTLLLIEDNFDHAEITRFYIHEYAPDIQITWLKDGQEAIDHILHIREHHQTPYPWLILLDIKLPKYDGHEVLSRLKATTELKSIPVVIFTTSNSNKDITTALQNGANSYLQKPVEPDDFENVIIKMIDYWRLNQHNQIIEQLNHHDG